MKRSLLLFFSALTLAAVLLTGCAKKQPNDKKFQTIQDLNGARIGISTGTTFDKLLDAALDDYTPAYFNTYADMIEALSSGKIDAYIGDDSWIRYTIASEPDCGTVMIPELLQYEEYGHVFAKNEHGAALRDAYNRFLAETLTEEVRNSMAEAWFVPDENVHPILDYDALPGPNGTLRIAMDGSYPPFTYVEKGRYTGYNLEVVYRFCEANGYRMELSVTQFDGLIPAVVSGKCDLACDSFTITPERAETIHFSTPVYSGGPALAIRRSDAAWLEEEDTASVGFFASLALSFEKNFIRESRWKLFVSGIQVTLFITAMSLLLGTLVGFGGFMWYRRGGRIFARFTALLDWLVTGMPEVLLLMILYYLVFGSININAVWVAIAGFALVVAVNVFGMVKGGVSAIDKGQTEAMLALGYGPTAGFFRMILPQALSYIMPNYTSFIVSLIKSTAVVGYISVSDLTKISDIVRSRTYEAFFPLIATAIIYYVLAALLVWLVRLLQRRLLPIRHSKKAILKGIRIDSEEVSV